MTSIDAAREVRPVAVRPARLRLRWWAVGLGALAGAMLLGVMTGPVALSPGAIAGELLDPLPFLSVDSGLSEQQAAILMQIRLPRVVLGALVGAMLSIAGAAYQGAFRNALADPYLLGAAAGAGLGATLAIAYGNAGQGLIPLAAFGGALAAVALAYSVGRSSTGRTATTLILAGIAIASFLTAVQTYVQQRESETLRQVYSWILGRLGTAGWSEVLLALPYIVGTSAVILLHRRHLDVLSVGDEEADSLGLDARRVRAIVIVAASLGTAAAVAVSGLIGFVGIIVPHTVRLVAGASYRVILPLSLAFGAAFMILADLLGRTVAAPAELPIGVVTAFFGAPFFALALRSSKRFMP
ncbi:MAG TPA: iron ABC transporter permease [Actinomycetota bacterium]